MLSSVKVKLFLILVSFLNVIGVLLSWLFLMWFLKIWLISLLRCCGVILCRVCEVVLMLLVRWMMVFFLNCGCGLL